MKILLFGGTIEGRKLSHLFAINGIEVVLFVATDYGKYLVHSEKNITVHSKRLHKDEMILYMAENKFDYVVDTTHPYADIVTYNIKSACEAVGIKYLRLVREKDEQNQQLFYVPTVEACVEMLKKTIGNILLTIGSKDLSEFTSIENYSNRIYIRMIPMLESLQKSQELGFRSENIICMQGPFDFELNKSILAWTSASYMVTKDSGNVGGFSEKVSAALDLDCKVIVIARPTQETGLSFNEISNFFDLKYEIQQKPSLKTFFPFFFDLSNKCIVVIGGGKIAERRISILVKFGANIVLISPTITKHLQKLLNRQKIKYIESFYSQSKLDHLKPFLIIAVTNDRTANQAIMRDAKKLGIPHIIADKKEECDTYFPAIAENDSFIAGTISKKGNHKALKSVSKNLFKS